MTDTGFRCSITMVQGGVEYLRTYGTGPTIDDATADAKSKIATALSLSESDDEEKED